MITINGLQYHTEKRQHKTTYDPLRTVNRGLSGKSIVQEFAGSIKRLEAVILVYLDGQAPNTSMGELSDLEAAFDAVPVSVTDAAGTRNMIFTGVLDLSRQFSLVDQTAPFAVPISLEEYVS